MEGVLALLALEQWQKTDSLSYEHDPFSPFAGCSGGRLNTRHRRRVALLSQGDGERSGWVVSEGLVCCACT